MKQPKKPTLAQKKLIAGAGLDPEKWMVRYEDSRYLHIIDRGVLEQREAHIIDRQTGQITGRMSDSGEGAKTAGRTSDGEESAKIDRKPSGSGEITVKSPDGNGSMKKCPGI